MIEKIKVVVKSYISYEESYDYRYIDREPFSEMALLSHYEKYKDVISTIVKKRVCRNFLDNLPVLFRGTERRGYILNMYGRDCENDYYKLCSIFKFSRVEYTRIISDPPVFSLQNTVDNYLSVRDITSVRGYSELDTFLTNFFTFLSRDDKKTVLDLIELYNDNFFFSSIEPFLITKFGVLLFVKFSIYFYEDESLFFKNLVKNSLTNSLNFPERLYFKYTKLSNFIIDNQRIINITLTSSTAASALLLTGYFYLFRPASLTYYDRLMQIPFGEGLKGNSGAIIERRSEELSRIFYTIGKNLVSPIFSFAHGVFDAKREILKNSRR